MFRCLKFFRGKALKYALLSILFVVLSAIANIGQPIFLMLITTCVHVVQTGDSAASIFNIMVTSANAWTLFWISVGVMGFTAVLGLFFGIISYYLSAKGSLVAVQNVRNACYKQILTYSFKELDMVPATSLITRLTNDCQKIQQAWQLLISTFLQCIIMMIGGGIIAFQSGWQMGIIVLIIFICMILISLVLGYKVYPMFGLYEKTIDHTSEVMRENVLGVRVIKSFNLEQQQIEDFDFANKGLRRIGYRSQIWIQPLFSIIQFAVNVGIIAIMIVGGVMLKKNYADPEKYVGIGDKIYGTVQTLIMVLMSAVGAVIVIVNIVRTAAPFKRINQVLDIQSSIKEKRNAKEIKNNYDIEFKNVSFKYSEASEEYVLKNLNFKVKSGKTLGIIGATGSGKSSLINLIPRLYDVTDGSITIGGTDVKDIKIDSLRKFIKVAIQEQILFAGDIQYNLRYGKPDATNEELVDACKQACAWEFISTLPRKLEAPVEQRGRNFSGGQKQRLCLARAVVAKPKILILDDVTCALDLLTEKTVQQNLNKSMPKTTKIIVSQRISSIINADKIIVLDKGTISGIGTHEKLVKTNKLYHDIVETQLNRQGMED